jgi:hypothetical protein
MFSTKTSKLSSNYISNISIAVVFLLKATNIDKKLICETQWLSLIDWFMVFIATFSNISVISWQSDLLVEETRVPG